MIVTEIISYLLEICILLQELRFPRRELVYSMAHLVNFLCGVINIPYSIYDDGNVLKNFSKLFELFSEHFV